MERLVQAIMMEVNGGGSWNPVKLVRNGPNISHLFFADDLVLFARALREQMVVIEKLLVELCQCLARQVSNHKIRVYFSKNVSLQVQIKISNGFGFERRMLSILKCGYGIINPGSRSARHMIF
ncbi:hypothetical protein V6Z11_A05G425200 [Gossypium hirsutum]